MTEKEMIERIKELEDALTKIALRDVAIDDIPEFAAEVLNRKYSGLLAV